MPVVSEDARDPASWIRRRTVYGVIKDGEILRFCRMDKSGRPSCFQCSLHEWDRIPDFRTRFEQERASGAGVAVGLEPHRVMLRTLNSPLKDRSKSAEIWGTLLDAAIPFSLEKCQVTFLPMEPQPDGGRRCLAVAARLEDLQDSISEWQGLGIDPDAIFPEELMLSAKDGNVLWLGQTRTLFSVWKEGRYAGGGGALKPELRQKVIARFEQTLPEVGSWERSGPESESQQNILEQSMARGLQNSSDTRANLRANELAEPGVAKRYARKQKTLKVCLLLFGLLLILFPLILRNQLKAYQNLLRSDISESYQELTGSPSTAPGQEVLLAQRYLEAQWGPQSSSMDTLLSPTLALKLEEILQAAKEQKVQLAELDLESDRVDLKGVSDDVHLTSFIFQLRKAGWDIERGPDENGHWHLYGGYVR